jgi:hypothetical protein
VDRNQCFVCEAIVREIEAGKHQDLLCKEILRDEDTVAMFLLIVAASIVKGVEGFCDAAEAVGPALGPQIAVTDSLFRILKVVRDLLLLANNHECASKLMDDEAEIRQMYSEMGLELETRLNPAVLN